MNLASDKIIKYIFINPNNAQQTEKLLHDAILNHTVSNKEIEIEIRK